MRRIMKSGRVALVVIALACWGAGGQAQAGCNSCTQSCGGGGSHADYTIGAGLAAVSLFMRSATFFDLIWLAL